MSQAQGAGDAPAKTYEVQLIPVAECHPPPWNPGDRHEDTSLAPSILETGGVESPILVRPLEGGGFQIVAGNRRWAGTAEAGFETVAAFVRPMTEDEAIQRCGIENLQRHDLAPLEESDWYFMMSKRDGEDVDSLAARFGRSRKFITDRIQLAENLSHRWRRAMAAKAKSSAGHVREWRFSLLVHVAKLAKGSQDDLLTEAREWRDVPTEARLIDALERRTRLLSSAPWKLADRSLVARKPCNGCASRSEAQRPLLFDDLHQLSSGKDRCLDAACWARKLERWLAARIDDLHAEHGEDFRLWFDGHGRVESEISGVPVIRSWDHRWTRVPASRKGKSGAHPALVIAGADVGKLIWIMDPRAATAAERDAKRPKDPGSKPAKKPLEERRRQLAGIRARIAAEELQGKLQPDPTAGEIGELPPPADVPLKDPRMALAMVVIFGTRRYYSQPGSVYSLHGDPVAEELLDGAELEGKTRWDLLDALLERPEEELLALLWRLTLPVMEERLNDVDPPSRNVLRTEVDRLAPLIDLDPADFWTTAETRKPTPKSWAREEAAAAAAVAPPEPKIKGAKPIPDPVHAVLAALEWAEDGTATIAAELPRTRYRRVKTVLESLGGRWDQDRGAHVFDGAGRAAVDEAVHFRRYVPIRKELGFYETSGELAEEIVGTVLEPFESSPGDASVGIRVLEPSAGRGALCRAVLARGCEAFAVEIHKPHCGALAKLGVTLHQGDFLDLQTLEDPPVIPASWPADQQRFPAIVMNPPHQKSQDIFHVTHAHDHFLAPGGRLVAIVSHGWTIRQDRRATAFREWFEARHGDLYALPDDAFLSQGVQRRTLALVIDKPKEEQDDG